MTRRVVFGYVLALGVATTVVAVAARESASDEALLKSAMSAAPSAIGNDATVIEASADGTMRTVRKGTNNYTCMADNPASPGPDPMCGDENAMAWIHAWLAKQTPPANKVGFVYMLAGGSDASNTDPHAQKPTASNNWITTGPHVMVVGAKGMMEGYPRNEKPDTAKPYVMWPGTPYEHLMVPVK
jgi:hypothetical protein